MEICVGYPEYTDKGTRDCSKCLYPHIPENYNDIIAILTQQENS
jgi:Zn-finger protein